MIAVRPFKGMGLGVKGISLIVRYFSKLGVDYITDQGEEHQRAWEAELLASSETTTLVDAATEGPTAAKGSSGCGAYGLDTAPVCPPRGCHGWHRFMAD